MSSPSIPHVSRAARPMPGQNPLPTAVWQDVVQALQLSPQQARIVELLLRGMRDKAMAETLGLGVPTVRTYLSRIFQRVGVEDRVELILLVFAVAEAARRNDVPREA